MSNDEYQHQSFFKAIDKEAEKKAILKKTNDLTIINQNKQNEKDNLIKRTNDLCKERGQNQNC